MNNDKLLELETRIQALEEMSDASFIEKIKKVIFEKRSSTAVPVGTTDTSAAAAPDSLYEVVIDDQRKYIGLYNG